MTKATQQPQVVTVTLPLQPSLIADPQAEKCYAQGLIGVLRESYPDPILEIWSDQAEDEIDSPPEWSSHFNSMASQLVISETRLDGQERVLMSRRQAVGDGGNLQLRENLS